MTTPQWWVSISIKDGSNIALVRFHRCQAKNLKSRPLRYDGSTDPQSYVVLAKIPDAKATVRGPFQSFDSALCGAMWLWIEGYTVLVYHVAVRATKCPAYVFTALWQFIKTCKAAPTPRPWLRGAGVSE